MPTIGYRGSTAVGLDLTLELHDAPMLASCVLLVGISNTMWDAVALPLDLGTVGFPGCSLLVAANAWLPSATDASGGAAATIEIPNAGLNGTTFFWQWFTATPGAPQPLHATAGIATTVP